MINQVFEEKILKFDKSKWKLTKLGTLAEDISVRVDKPGESVYDRFVGLDNFVSGDIKIKSWASTKNLTSSAKAFKAGDILFARRNAYLRRASLVDFDGCCSGDAFVIREKEDKVVPGFLAFLMNANSLWDYANSNAAGTMSKRVKWRDLAEYEFLLPPKAEQARLAELLWAIENVVERWEIAKKEYQQFVKRYSFDSISGKLSSTFSKWKEYRFGDLGDSFGGLTGKTKNDFGDGAPFINYMNIFKNSKVDPSQIDYVKIEKDESQNELQYGDILITGSSETPEELGMTSVVLDDLKGYYLNSFCFGFRLNNFDILLPEYARYLMRSESVRNFMFKHAQGSTRFNLSKTIVKSKLKFKLPSLTEQKQIADTLNSLEYNLSLFEPKLKSSKDLKKKFNQRNFLKTKMNKLELNKLNLAIKSLHKDGDVYDYEIDKSRRIDFPRGFLKTLFSNRSFLKFLSNKKIIENIALHMMHRDTLHWLWLKTDIGGDARKMLIKFQLINLGSILEAIVKDIYPKVPKGKDDVYYRIERLELEKNISNVKDLKQLWLDRKSIHLHLFEETKGVVFSDQKYINWHNSMSILIKELNHGI